MNSFWLDCNAKTLRECKPMYIYYFISCFLAVEAVKSGGFSEQSGSFFMQPVLKFISPLSFMKTLLRWEGKSHRAGRLPGDTLLLSGGRWLHLQTETHPAAQILLFLPVYTPSPPSTHYSRAHSKCCIHLRNIVIKVIVICEHKEQHQELRPTKPRYHGVYEARHTVIMWASVWQNNHRGQEMWTILS